MICRKTTERPEAIGLSSFIIGDPSILKSEFDRHIKNYAIDITSPYGNGKASSVICGIFKLFIDRIKPKTN